MDLLVMARLELLAMSKLDLLVMAKLELLAMSKLDQLVMAKLELAMSKLDELVMAKLIQVNYIDPIIGNSGHLELATSLGVFQLEFQAILP